MKLNIKFLLSFIIGGFCICQTTYAQARDMSSWETFLEFRFNNIVENPTTTIGSEIYDKYMFKDWLRNEAEKCIKSGITSADDCKGLKMIKVTEDYAVLDYVELKLSEKTQNSPGLSEKIKSVRGQKHKIVSQWDKDIPLTAFQSKLIPYTDITLETKVKSRYRIGYDSQYEAINLIFDASNIFKKQNQFSSRKEKSAIDNWMQNFSNYFNVEKNINLPGGNLLGGYGPPPKIAQPVYINKREYLVNPKYNKLFKNKFNNSLISIRDIRIHVSDFRCVYKDKKELLCVIPHNDNTAFQTSINIRPYSTLLYKFKKQWDSLDAFPGDVISMNVIIRGYREAVLGGGSDIFINPLKMEVAEKERFKVIGNKLK
jgi:hypothetical protein